MKKKSLLLIITAVIMVTALAVGGTLAYFTGADNATNTFTVGNVAIKLYEHSVEKVTINDTGLTSWRFANVGNPNYETNANRYEGIYPGAVLPKDPTIRNTGSNPAYVRIKVTISNASAWTSALGAGYNLNNIFGGFDSSKWTRAGDPTTASNQITYVYNYNSILLPHTGTTYPETGPLFTSVTIPSDFDNADMTSIGSPFTIQMTAEAIQADGFANSTAAFSALNAQLAP